MGWAVEPYDRSTFHEAESPEVYITYPLSKEFERQTIRVYMGVFLGKVVWGIGRDLLAFALRIRAL